MRHISPQLRSDGKGYRVQFRNPYLKNKNVTASLGTRDAEEARAICHDISILCSNPELWQDPTSPRLLGYDRRAVEIFFGRDHKEAIDKLYSNAVFETGELEKLEFNIATEMLPDVSDMDNIHIPGSAEAIDWVRNVLKQYSPRKFTALQERCKELEIKVKAVLPRIAELEEENERLRRVQNFHVKVTIQNAFDQWKAGRALTLASKTQKEACYGIESFIKSLPETQRFKLAKVRASHINTWLEGVKSKTGTELSPVTKSKMKRYLGMFMTWSYQQFDLVENPVEKSQPLAGVTKNGEKIVAINRLAAFQEMLDTLKKVDLYWYAVVATAVLTGPRFSELAWLRLDQVNLDQNYIRIATREESAGRKHTKTGKERNVPIETTTLLPILRAHLDLRKREQRKRTATVAEQSSFLFPSVVPDNIYKPRIKAPPGIWSENGVFLDAWRKIAAKCEAITGARDYWKYGPREWRHCGGTAMGHSGNDSVRVSAWLGTSETMCRRHYVRPSDSGTLWPYKW